MIFLWLLFFGVIEPALPIHGGPIYRVSPEYREEWMEGERATVREAARNREIFAAKRVPWLHFVLITLTGVGVAFVVYLIRKKPKEKKLQEQIEIALAQLKKDDDASLVKVAHYLRALLEEEYHVPALSSTTEEILSYTALPSDLHKKVKEVLQASDAMQFAKEKTHPGTLQEAFSIVSTFILTSKDR